MHFFNEKITLYQQGCSVSHIIPPLTSIISVSGCMVRKPSHWKSASIMWMYKKNIQWSFLLLTPILPCLHFNGMFSCLFTMILELCAMKRLLFINVHSSFIMCFVVSVARWPGYFDLLSWFSPQIFWIDFLKIFPWSKSVKKIVLWLYVLLLIV